MSLSLSDDTSDLSSSEQHMINGSKTAANTNDSSQGGLGFSDEDSSCSNVNNLYTQTKMIAINSKDKKVAKQQ